MKKIKTLLIPLTAIAASSSLVLPLTSCNKSQDQSTKYSVTINNSNRFSYDENLVGKDKAIKNEIYTIKLTCVDNFQINKSDVTIKINNKTITDFACTNGIISIPSYRVTGNIIINVAPTVINLFNIDKNTHQLKGFTAGLTSEDITNTCKGKLVIPASVTSIAEDAFYDASSDTSTIPESVKDLSFEEMLWAPIDYWTQQKEKIVGYSGLKNQGEIAGIGKRAFKKSPFTHIKLPIGFAYTIDSYAFEDSKVQVLEMPNPDYIKHERIFSPDDVERRYGDQDFDEGIFDGKPGEYTLGNYLYMDGISQKQHISKWNWMILHQITIMNNAFYNTKDLVYLNFTPFVKYDSNATSCFKLKNSVEGEEDLPSNAKVLDFTYWTWSGYYDPFVSEARQGWMQQSASMHDEFTNSGNFSLGQFLPLATQFNLYQKGTSNDSLVYVLLLDEYDQLGDQTKQKNYNNEIAQFFQLQVFDDPIFGLAKTLDGQDSNTVFVRSIRNVSAQPGSTHYPVDIGLKEWEQTKNISLSTEEDRYVEINIESPFKDEGDTRDYQISTYGLKGDFEYEIIAEPLYQEYYIPQKEPEVPELPFTLKHVKKSDLPPSEQATYKNNKFMFAWDNDNPPKLNVPYEFWFKIKSVHMNRTSAPIHFTVAFTE